MIELQRGMRGKLSDHINCNDMIEIVVSVSGGDVYDYTCFGLDASSKLSDDRYMLFYNQTNSPNNEIQLRQAADGAHFQIRLSALPQTIHKLVFTVSIDGNGTMAMINNHTFTISQGGTQRLALHMTGKDFHAEKAIISVEFYRKDGIWRFAAVANGFNGGLSDLLKFYGGEEVSSQSPAPPPVKTVAPSVQIDNHTVPEPCMTGNEIYSHLNFGSNTFSRFFDGVIDVLEDMEVDGENIFDIMNSILLEYQKMQSIIDGETKLFGRSKIQQLGEIEEKINALSLHLDYSDLDKWDANGTHRAINANSVIRMMSEMRKEFKDDNNIALNILHYYYNTMNRYIEAYRPNGNMFSNNDDFYYQVCYDNIGRISRLIEKIELGTDNINKSFMSFWEHTCLTPSFRGQDGEYWLDINWMCYHINCTLSDIDYDNNRQASTAETVFCCVPVAQLFAFKSLDQKADRAAYIWYINYSYSIYQYLIGKILFLFAIVFIVSEDNGDELFNTNEDNFFDEL